MPLTRTRELFKLQQTWYFGENTANKVDLVIKGLKNEIKRPKKSMLHMTEHGGSLTFHTLIKNHVKFLKFQPYVTEFARKKTV